MDVPPLANSPFAVLTFIVAPAVLTNASSVMTMSTSNRFARTIDRTRALAAELEEKKVTGSLAQLRGRQLRYATRRVMLLVRALTAFYVSLGAFAAASLTALLGAVLVMANEGGGAHAATFVALGCGAVGIGGLVSGSVVLVWESRFALRSLAEETRYVVTELKLDGPPPPPEPRDPGD